MKFSVPFLGNFNYFATEIGAKVLQIWNPFQFCTKSLNVHITVDEYSLNRTDYIWRNIISYHNWHSKLAGLYKWLTEIILIVQEPNTKLGNEDRKKFRQGRGFTSNHPIAISS